MSDADLNAMGGPEPDRTGTPVMSRKTVVGDDNLDMNAMNRKRLERDLQELKKLIAIHFEQRKKDEEDLECLKVRIENRKTVREEQLAKRAEREKQRAEREKKEKERKERDELEKQKLEEEKRAAAMTAMSMAGSMAGASRERRQRRGGDKDKKKKILAERRKQLNIDHMSGEKLQEKVIELHTWMSTLEDEKYDLELTFDSQKYELKALRTRVNDLMGKKSRKVNVRKWAKTIWSRALAQSPRSSAYPSSSDIN